MIMQSLIAIKPVYLTEDEKIQGFDLIGLPVEMCPHVGDILTVPIARRDEPHPVDYVMEVMSIEHRFYSEDRKHVIGLVARILGRGDEEGEETDPKFDQWLPTTEQPLHLLYADQEDEE